jgi:hypothetical protein
LLSHRERYDGLLASPSSKAGDYPPGWKVSGKMIKPGANDFAPGFIAYPVTLAGLVTEN